MLKNKHWVIILVGVFATFCCQNAFADDYSLSMTSSGSQSVNVQMGSDGTGTSISEDQITVNTTCRYGYNLAIGASVNDNNLYLDGDSTKNATGTFFSPSDGSTALSSAANTWGYYFSSSTAPTDASIFSPVPALGSAQASIVTESSTPGSGTISDSFSIYYGVNVSNTIVPGTYTMIPDTNNNNADGTIVYYLTMATNCIPYTIHFDPTSTESGFAVSGTGTMADQEVYKDVTTTLNPSSFTPPAGYSFMGWNTEQDGSGDYYADEEEITDLAAPSGSITLYAMWWQPPYLYNEVANQVKTYGGSPQTQAAADLKTDITEPTSSDPATDTSNSGVFLYDASTFGVASDANNDYDIYYYRGILDSNMSSGTYSFNNIGSNGNSAYYQNYVKLDNGTCWRIVRTTGSGGVKMIYNGLYGATNGGSCANTAKSTTMAETSFASAGGNKKYVGYTYNNSVATTTSFVSVDTVYGSNDNYSTTNTTDSAVKDYIENTWYTYSMTDYTSILEPSAGYCNDRTAYYDDGDHTPSLTTSVRTDSADYNGVNTSYGAHVRTKPTLTCTRGTVDLYTTSLADDGNNQLKYPVAMLTADELSFAGSASMSEGGANGTSWRSFLKSNSNEIKNASWTMSPYYADYEYSLSYGGQGVKVSTSSLEYVRPAVSLIHDVYVASGSGTASDPWIISTEPPRPPEPVETINLYDAVAEQSKGTQTAEGLQATISASNSGVYEYDSSVFGTATDASNDFKIYYYRGILDNTTGNYGSDGDGGAYPNYVILDADNDKTTSDTCWRIIRTTGSGGVKMIYNGNWNGSTCANATTSAQISLPVATSTFNGTANTNSVARQVVRIGYTHNSAYATTSNSSQPPNTLFGSDTNYSVNNTNSTVKGNVENWYNSNLTSYTSILEPNAGYCNDRSAFQDTSGSTATVNLRSYTTNANQAGTTYRAYFGAYTRNIGTSKVPGLGCSKSTVDVYSTSTSAGGNGQLAAPVALITADEASFAGSGSQTANQGSGYNANSFLRTGSNFWTMSPYYRYGSYAYNFYLNTTGYMQNGRIDTAYGIRPVISLQEGTEATSGTGTATDPWVVVAP